MMQTQKQPQSVATPRPKMDGRRVALCLAGLLWAVLLALLLLFARPQPGTTHLALETGHHLRRAGGMAVPQPEGPVNMNTATLEELTQIKYVGPSLAEKIILERETNGPFYYREDLLNVHGIGEKTLQKLDGQFCLD
jgi:competence ComEA-like helix-hairpin-helix protein